MASAWGQAWGTAWGNSWGTIPEPTTGGGQIGPRGPSGKVYSRERFDKLFDELQAAQRKIEKRAYIKRKAVADRRDQLKKVAETTQAELYRIDKLSLDQLNDPDLLAGMERFSVLMAEAARANTLAIAIERAEAARAEAAAFYDQMLRIQDEDDVIALLLA